MLHYSKGKGVQPIIPGVTNIQGVNVPLVAFDALVDTDFGLMLYIDRNFLDQSVFDVEFFNSHHTIREMLSALVNREEWNPLYQCMNKQKLLAPDTIADEIYKGFMTDKKHNHYEQIVELSMLTNLCDFIRLSESSGREVRPTILCHTEFEKDFVKKKISKTIPVVLYTHLHKDKDDYQQFFFKSVYDSFTSMEDIAEIIGKDKSIYLANYKFNDIDNPEKIKQSPFLESLVVQFNRIKIYDPYDRELFKKEANEDGFKSND